MRTAHTLLLATSVLACLTSRVAVAQPGPSVEAPPVAEEAPAETPDVSSYVSDPGLIPTGVEGDGLDAPSLRLYGFMDMGFFRFFMPKDHLVYGFQPTTESTFLLGNVNLYADIHAAENWDGLIELRYSLQPHGQDAPGLEVNGLRRPYSRTSTLVRDWYAPGGGAYRTQWGSVIVERAYVDHTITNYLTLRVGQWFTPYGIWNVDHGTPTLISLVMPQVIVFELFPARQTGIQAFGTSVLGNAEYGYHAFVSNGRTATPVDFTDDKMVGGRLFARRHGRLAATLGVSGLYGRNTDVEKVITNLNDFTVERRRTIDYREIGLAADLAADLGPLRFRAEVAMRDVVYKGGRREPVEGTPLAFKPDRTEWGWYLVSAYRLPFWGMEPFLSVEQLSRPDELGLPNNLIAPSGGLNFYLKQTVQIKTHYGRPTWYGATGGQRNQGFGNFQARLVLVF